MEISHFPFSVDTFLLDSDTVPKSSWQMTDIQVIDDSNVQESKGMISYFPHPGLNHPQSACKDLAL